MPTPYMWRIVEPRSEILRQMFQRFVTGGGVLPIVKPAGLIWMNDLYVADLSWRVFKKFSCQGYSRMVLGAPLVGLLGYMASPGPIEINHVPHSDRSTTLRAGSGAAWFCIQ